MAVLASPASSSQYPAASDNNHPAASKAAHPKHGLKRSAEDNLENEQRLSKRFDLLNIENNGKLWTQPGVSSGSDTQVVAARAVAPQRPPVKDDYMQVEDTRDRVYIHNLDEELESDDEIPEGERLIFLPDIERKLNTLPREVFLNEEQLRNTASAGNELVLYHVPSSLSVPREQDSVRKAIIESRARSRQKGGDSGGASSDSLLHDELQESRAMDTREVVSSNIPHLGSTMQSDRHYYGNDDEDAMDLG